MQVFIVVRDDERGGGSVHAAVCSTLECARATAVDMVTAWYLSNQKLVTPTSPYAIEVWTVDKGFEDDDDGWYEVSMQYAAKHSDELRVEMDRRLACKQHAAHTYTARLDALDLERRAGKLTPAEFSTAVRSLGPHETSILCVK